MGLTTLATPPYTRPVDPQEANERILKAFKEELRHSGRIAEIEAALGRHRGYFSRIGRAKFRMSLPVLLEGLAALEVEPIDFFIRALGEAGQTLSSSDPFAELRREGQRKIRQAAAAGRLSPALAAALRMLEEPAEDAGDSDDAG